VSLLIADHIAKSYTEAHGRLQVLQDCCLCINAGEMIAVTGESGCGKSTLLHVLGMLDAPDSGEIRFKGNLISLKDKTIHEFRNKHIGFVFQFHYLLEDFTAEENIAMPQFLATRNFGKSVKAARELLKQLGLYDRRDHYPHQLSGGEQQRIAVGRALINRPEIIFADEPTGNLDPHHSAELVELFHEFNRTAGQTMVIVTHDMAIANDAGQHYVLANGVLHPA
jgi:lipoprotein-releasing system ATP-binding protein